LIDKNGLSKSEDWHHAHAAIETAISEMSWPSGSKGGLIIPRIVSIKPGEQYTDLSGKIRTWKDGKNGKKKTLRNGVVPLRQLFRANLEGSGWKAEEPLSLKEYFERIRKDDNLAQIFMFPETPIAAVLDPLHEGVGDFDFWLRSDRGFRTVVEWETGNISSSHRSLNKMCLALTGGLVDAAVLVVPSAMLYVHLTDRIGNVRELQPYFYFWNMFAQLLDKGLLAIIVVEQDGLIHSTDLRDFIPAGTDGNAKKSARLKTRKAPARKRVKPGS
jgi:hypothetical protein